MGFDGEGCLAGWSDSVNIEVFNHFSEKHMLPKLKKGDFVVWDNARFHGDTKLERKLIRRGVKLVRLPRYSPDYNPIEKLWQKLKHYLKKARIDLFSELESGVIDAMAKIKVSDIEGWYRSCGFRTSMN
jgi:transposase